MNYYAEAKGPWSPRSWAGPGQLKLITAW